MTTDYYLPHYHLDHQQLMSHCWKKNDECDYQFALLTLTNDIHYIIASLPSIINNRAEKFLSVT